MKFNRAIWLGAVLTALALVVTAWLYDRLPAALPVHWNIRGEADGFMAKPWGALFYPGLIAAMTLLAALLPALSPRGFRIAPFARIFDILMTALVVFFAYSMAIVFAGALGLNVPVNRAVLAGIGALFIVIGNFLGKVTKNFFVGIRTPWTLSNDEVWLRTHRLGSWLFVVAGATLIVASLIGRGFVLAFALILIAVIVPVAYSFVVHRQIERTEKPPLA